MARKDDHQTQKEIAKYIAMVVRNEMEDFHCEHLTDAQMKELNLIIRNAIYTALYAAQMVNVSEGAAKFVQFQMQLVPDYWEEPVLTQDFIDTERHFKKKKRKTD